MVFFFFFFFLGAMIGEISVFRSRFSWVYVTGFYGFRSVQIKAFFFFDKKSGFS